MKEKNLVRCLLVTILLGLGIATLLPGINARAQEQAQQSPWKGGRAEYDAFNAILQAKDPAQQVELADKYLAAYPESNFLKEVHEMKLQAYQNLNNGPKMEETANKLLEINPNNLRALLLLSYLFPRTVNAQDAVMEEKLNKAAEYARRGLEQLAALPAPQGVSPEDFQKQKDQSASVFHQASGFIALQKKDYPAAEQDLRKSAQTNPNDALGFYWLGLAYLLQKPPNHDQGIWALARSISVTGATALPDTPKAQAKDYLTKVFDARHGSTDGLEDVLTQATSAPFPPDGFHIASVEELAPPEPEPEPEPPPAPARVLTVKIEELTDFGVIQQYLQAGGAKEADTWELLKGSVLPLPGKVVSATPAAAPTKILLAVAPELATQPGKHDVELTLAEPHARRLAAGATINFEGTLDAYTAKPFLLKMVNGKVLP